MEIFIVFIIIMHRIYLFIFLNVYLAEVFFSLGAYWSKAGLLKIIIIFYYILIDFDSCQKNFWVPNVCCKVFYFYFFNEKD